MAQMSPHFLSQGSSADRGPAGRSLWADARRRILGDWAAKLCIAVIAIYALVAVGGVVYEIIAEKLENVPTFKETMDYAHGNEPPSLRGWHTVFGTDWQGKSVLVKTLLGAKVSMSVALISNLIAVPLGIILGALAGYYGKWIDSIVVWIFSTLACIPGIILLIAMKFAFKDVKIGPLDMGGIGGMYVALGMISWIGTCRLVRAETMKLRELDYVIAARASGRNSLAILIHHILPNVSHLGIIRFSLGFVAAVQAEVILSYLELGVKVGTPSWGTMINDARIELARGDATLAARGRRRAGELLAVREPVAGLAALLLPRHHFAPMLGALVPGDQLRPRLQVSILECHCAPSFLW